MKLSKIQMLNSWMMKSKNMKMILKKIKEKKFDIIKIKKINNINKYLIQF